MSCREPPFLSHRVLFFATPLYFLSSLPNPLMSRIEPPHTLHVLWAWVLRLCFLICNWGSKLALTVEISGLELLKCSEKVKHPGHRILPWVLSSIPLFPDFSSQCPLPSCPGKAWKPPLRPSGEIMCRCWQLETHLRNYVLTQVVLLVTPSSQTSYHYDFSHRFKGPLPIKTTCFISECPQISKVRTFYCRM